MKNFKVHNISSFAHKAKSWSATRDLVGKAFDELNTEQDVFTLPMFLRDQKFSSEIIETCQLESYSAQLLDWIDVKAKSQEFPRGNPSCMSLVVKYPHSFLDEDFGLFVLWTWENQIKALKVQPQVAEVLDALEEGNLALLHTYETKDLELFQFLRNEGIIV